MQATYSSAANTVSYAGVVLSPTVRTHGGAHLIAVSRARTKIEVMLISVSKAGNSKRSGPVQLGSEKPTCSCINKLLAGTQATTGKNLLLYVLFHFLH